MITAALQFSHYAYHYCIDCNNYCAVIIFIVFVINSYGVVTAMLFANCH